MGQLLDSSWKEYGFIVVQEFIGGFFDLGQVQLIFQGWIIGQQLVGLEVGVECFRKGIIYVFVGCLVFGYFIIYKVN